MGAEKARGPQVLTAPSLRSVAIKDYEIDVLGFRPTEAPDHELDLIDRLLADMQNSLHTFVLLKRAARESDSSLNKDTKKKQDTLWKKFECKRQGDGVPFGRAFDMLLVRCELQDSRK